VTAACAASSGAAEPGTSAPIQQPIATLHQRACGHCHVPPEPGTHTRPQLEDAFARHKRRTHLSDGEWHAMADYLAAPAN
jgi:hypothetical protein